MSQRNPSSKPPVRPAGARSASTHHRHRTPEQEELLAKLQHERAERTRQSMRMGLMWIGGFLVVAGIGGFVWYQSAAKAAQQRADQLAHYTALRTELLDEASLAPEKAQALLRRIDATRAEWEHGVDADKIERQAELARAAATNAAAQQAVAADLGALQKELASAGKTADAWKGLHEKALAVRARVPKAAADLHKELDQLLDRIDAGWFDALLAQGAAAAPNAAVAPLVAAEDIAVEAVEATAKSRPAQDAWKQRLQELTPRLDAAMKAAYTDAAIAAVPTQDLKTQEADWVPSTGSSLVRKLQGDTLSLQVDGGKNAHSGLVVLRRQAWHACALSFDVKLDRGKAELFARAHSQFAGKSTGAVVLATTEAPGAVVVPAGQEVHVEVTVVGDQVVATVDHGTPQKVELHVANNERSGAIAAIVHPDTALAIRHLRIRKLG